MEIQSSIRNKKVILFVAHHQTGNKKDSFTHPTALAQVEEFKELSRAAGMQCKGLLSQILKKIHPATFIGKGKIQELKQILQDTDSQLIVFNCSLSGIQIRNIKKETGVAVIDRNQLILDIFAQRARTYEGKLQVELAYALDELSRMVGAWMSSLSRQGGGIGVKGPGEKAIETDRRVARQRIQKIRQKLEKIRRVRKGHRALRKKNKMSGLALIGYTNSGKSALFNSLTHSAPIPVKNLPFMTLDPTTRKVCISDSQKALITDTVGFIQDLSPHLIEAFKATLEESASADVLLHVIDLSSPLMKEQINTVKKLILEFSWNQTPCIHVYNKMDIALKENFFHAHSGPKAFVSALTGAGLDKLKKIIEEVLSKTETEEVKLYFPENEEKKIYSLSRQAFIYKKEISSLGILCYVRMRKKSVKKLERLYRQINFLTFSFSSATRTGIAQRLFYL